jgi:hypothetical protein
MPTTRARAPNLSAGHKAPSRTSRLITSVGLAGAWEPACDLSPRHGADCIAVGNPRGIARDRVCRWRTPPLTSQRRSPPSGDLSRRSLPGRRTGICRTGSGQLCVEIFNVRAVASKMRRAKPALAGRPASTRSRAPESRPSTSAPSAASGPPRRSVVDSAGTFGRRTNPQASPRGRRR